MSGPGLVQPTDDEPVPLGPGVLVGFLGGDPAPTSYEALEESGKKRIALSRGTTGLVIRVEKPAKWPEAAAVLVMIYDPPLKGRRIWGRASDLAAVVVERGKGFSEEFTAQLRETINKRRQRVVNATGERNQVL